MRAILILVLFFSLPAFSGTYDAIDAHALAASLEDERTVTSLAQYLSASASGEEEKARAIYRWMTDRIGYDVDAFLRQNAFGSGSVLYSRKGLCSDYARLFETLAKAAGLEVAVVQGRAKGYGYQPGGALIAHAWNAVRINGQWRLIDAAWGAGYVRDGRFVKAYSERYFLPPPEELAFSHYPDEPSWQFQSRKLTLNEFERLPLPGPAFFNLDIPGAHAWQAVSRADFGSEFVHTFDTPYHIVHVLDAPLAYLLQPGSTLHWMFESSAFEKMAVSYGRRWIEMDAHAGRFEKLLRTGASGEITIYGKQPGQLRYRAILAYRVR